MSAAALSPIYIKPLPPDQVEDLFERTALIEQVSGYIERLPEGGVFAIDAPWGDGKTWFGQRMEKVLADKGHKTVYLDAFQQDYIDDPYLMICAEMLSAISSGDERKAFKDAVAKVSKAVLPLAGKIAIMATSRIVLGSAGALEELKGTVEEATDDIGDSVESAIRKQLDEYESKKVAVADFRKLLSDAASQQKHGKIIVFIDELDRCKPTFAVNTIERIKHLFDVPGMVFILLMNREQMVESISGIYGGIDAEGYLGKFVQFSLSLPKLAVGDGAKTGHNRAFARKTLKQYGHELTEHVSEFADTLAIFADYMKMSFRDIERAVVLFSLAQPLNAAAPYAAWPIALRVKDDALFKRIRSNDAQAHEAASVRLSEYGRRYGQHLVFILCAELHVNHSNKGPFEDFALSEIAHHAIARIGTYRHHQADFLPWLFRRVDLGIEG